MRITRLCTIPETRNKRLKELKNMLLEQEYRPGMIDSAIENLRDKLVRANHPSPLET